LLLTGAAGFTGKHFSLAAKQAGHETVELGVDLTDSAGLKSKLASFERCDAVVHLAAISFVGHADNAEFYAVNTVGTTNLLSALVDLPPEKRPQKVLLASSANVYGNCEHSPIGETQAPAPINHYAASKLAMEQMACTFADRLPIAIARPFNYTGPGQAPSFLIPKLIHHFANRAPNIELGNLNVEREFNDVRMVCEVYLRLIEGAKTGEIYNVCSGNTFSLQQVIDQLTKITGHSIKVKVNPDFVRANEVHRLSGSPTKLLECIGALPPYTLEETLVSMLQSHAIH
jgi:GDP-6-deoxy-D-talose 4-dehydrogenase